MICFKKRITLHLMQKILFSFREYKDLINGIYSAFLNLCSLLKSIFVGNVVYLILDNNGCIATANECIHNSWRVV